MSYELYEPVAAAAATSAGREPVWHVAVEYSNQGNAKPPTVVDIGSTAFTDRAQALRAAEQAAFEYQPPDPWAPQGREVYRDGADGFLVLIAGATTVFHMSVRLVSPVPAPGAP